MKLTHLTVKNIRIHIERSVRFSDKVTLVTGANGSGKTSLIEAVYIALRGRSFRGTDDMIVGDGREWYRVDIDTTEGVRTAVYDLRGGQKKKTFIVEDKKFTRLPERLKYPVILFEPDDLMIVNGSPSRRRQYIDTMIAQYDSTYATLLSRYDRALTQRNKLLKREHATNDALFPWDVVLSRYGAEIINKRHELLELLNAQVTETYRIIGATSDTIELAYSSAAPITTEYLLKQYEAHADRDRMLKMTTVGPHRHDVLIGFNGSPASEVGSRGENRTIILALKFLEAAHIERLIGKKPIILLDDVFGELDDTRQRLLLKEFKDNQIIMTSASVKGRNPAGSIVL